jgi:hypothetical protein
MRSANVSHPVKLEGKTVISDAEFAKLKKKKFKYILKVKKYDFKKSFYNFISIFTTYASNIF